FLLEVLCPSGGHEHAVTDGVVDLVQDHEIPVPGLNRLLGFRPGIFHHAHVFRIGFLRANLHEATTHLLHDELIAKGLDRIELAVVPRALQELQHQDTHALADGAQAGSYRGGGFALPRAGVYDDESTANVRHRVQTFYCTRLRSFRPSGARP